MSTPKKAPKAWVATSALRHVLKEYRENICGRDFGIWLENQLATAEQAERRAELAEAAQRVLPQSDSVPALMEECAEAVGPGDRVHLTWLHRSSSGYHKWKAWTTQHDGDYYASDPSKALRALLAQLKPATPNASWLDDASFEDVEALLPASAEICPVYDSPGDIGDAVAVIGYCVSADDGPLLGDTTSDGPTRPTRRESMCAFLAAHPELWEGKR